MTGAPQRPARGRLLRALGLAVLVVLTVVTVVAAVLTWPQDPSRVDGPQPTPSSSGPFPGGSPTSAAPPPSTPPPSSEPPEPQPTLSAPPLVPCPHGRGPVHLSVMTLNIHGALGHGRYDLERIASEIEAWGADVVLLQEVDRHRERTLFTDQSLWLAQRLQLYSAYGANVVRPPARADQRPSEYGTLVLSRHPVFDTDNLRLPNRPGLEQRGLLRATIDVDGTRIDVYNTHLQHTSGDIRREQAAAIRAMLAERSLPTVLGGDLNAEPDSPALTLIGRDGLVDPWPEVGDGAGLTVPAGSPRRRIDFVLHDEKFRATGASTRLSAVSDHRAVLLDLVLRRPRTCPVGPG